MKVFEMAKKYYPRLWDEDRLRQLVDAGRLTEDEYQAIVGGVADAGNRYLQQNWHSRF